MMKSRDCLWHRAIAVATIASALLLLSAPHAWSKPTNNPGISPPWSKAHGASYPDWAAAWAAWAFGFPADQSPFLDPDGSLCQQGQSGPVFFLAGDFFGDPPVRSCTIPTGKSVLFSPVGGLCILGVDGSTEDELRTCVNDVVDGFENVSAEVDDKVINSFETYRVTSPMFSFTVPEGNIFGLDPGVYQAVVGGYFFIHVPLSVGQHVIHFHGELPAFDLVSDVTYTITVAPTH